MAKAGKQDKDTLKVKEEVFVQELIKDKTQRVAYRIAFPHSQRWKDNTVDVKASKLFSKDKIQARYRELKERLRKESEEECIVDAKEILKEYKKIAFSNIKDFLEYKTETNMVQCGHEEYPRYTQVIKMKDSKEVDGTIIQEVSINSKGTFTFKLHDKIKALDKLASYVRLIKPEGEEEPSRDDGLTEQIKKASAKVWGDFEDE